MPKLNGTGPEGKGAKTGRKLGNCEKVPFDELLQKLGKGNGQTTEIGRWRRSWQTAEI